MPPSRLVLAARATVVLAVAAFMIGGPVYEQGFGGRSKLLFHWMMFSGFGTEVCDVHYFERDQAGTLTELDRYAVLGVERSPSTARSVWKVKDADAAEALGRKLCRALPAGTDVRLKARCATTKGWRSVAKAETDLCVSK